MPDYSEYRSSPGDNLLAQISATAARQKDVEARIEAAEAELKAAQAELRRISEVELPELMDAADVASFTTTEGIKVEVREVIRGGIPSGTAEQAYAWLEDNGHAALIKRQFVIEFNRDEEAWAKKFAADLSKRKQKLRAKIKKTVHPQTLQAFVREQLEEGVEFPMQTFGVFRQRYTKVSVKDE